MTKLSVTDARKLWKSLYTKANTAINTVLNNVDAYSEMALLDAVSFVARSYLKVCEGSGVVDSFVKTLHSLHGVMLALPMPAASVVQAEIAATCELFWTQERTGRDNFAPSTITYLILKALDPSARANDVRRVYAMRAGLLLFDYADPSSEGIKLLLCRCVVCPAFLRVPDGRKLCAYFFGLYPPLIDNMHSALKNQIPGAKKSVLKAIGEVYYTAWSHSTGQFLLRVESSCLSDLAYSVLHASTPSLSTALRRVLGAFHNNKKHNGVDSALYRAYAPVLWKSLNVANPLVRRNAAALLVDAFPLHDTDAVSADGDDSMQLQFNCLDDMLDDDVPAIRVVGVHGVCRVLGVYWELVPSEVAKELLLKLVKDMASDGSSAAVRSAVFDGLSYVLDNHLTHHVLRTLLPVLQPLISDTSIKVRTAFLKMLLLIKGMRGIKFNGIVTVEDLLERLVVETPALQLAITELLLPTYFPQDVAVEEQVGRMIECVRRNSAACHIFYSIVHEYIPTGTIAKLTRRLCRTVYWVVSCEDEDDEDASEALSRRDADTVEGLLDAAAIMWQTTTFDHKVSKTLSAVFNESKLQEILDAYPDSDTVKQSVLSIASHIKAKRLHGFIDGAMEQLEGMDIGSDVNEYAALLDCLCAWGRVGELLTLLTKWLVKPDEKKKRRKGQVDRRRVGLKVIEHLMKSERTRSVFLAADLSSIMPLLECSERLAMELSVREEGAQRDENEAEYMLDAMERWCLIILHKAYIDHDEDEDSVKPPLEYRGLCGWISAVVSPYARTSKSLLGAQVATRILGVLVECPVLGIEMDEWCDELVDCVWSLLNTTSDDDCPPDTLWEHLLPLVCRLAYQLSHTVQWRDAVHGRLVALLISCPDTVSCVSRLSHAMTSIIDIAVKNDGLPLSTLVINASVCLVEEEEKLSDLPYSIQCAMRPWTHSSTLLGTLIKGWGIYLMDGNTDEEDVQASLILMRAAVRGIGVVPKGVDEEMVKQWSARCGTDIDWIDLE